MLYQHQCGLISWVILQTLGAGSAPKPSRLRDTAVQVHGMES